MDRIKDSCTQVANLARKVAQDLESLAVQMEHIPVETAVDLTLGKCILQSNAVSLELQKQQMNRRAADLEIICSLLRQGAEDMGKEIPRVLLDEIKKE